MSEYVIERLSLPVSEAELMGLAGLLVATVNAGGSVSFLAPLSVETAAGWWRKTLAAPAEKAVFLVARGPAGEIAGTVQLQPSWAPNQPHHAEVAKLMVHPSCRRGGVGRRLMERIEAEARAAGFRLLTLDTRQGDAAEQLYPRLGWVRVGVIPNYALNPDGNALHNTVVFYKEL